MADYRAINTADYSDVAGWEFSTDGGLNWSAATQLPTVADGVYANGFIKDVDVDSFASFYSNRPSTGVVAGGRFNINSGVTMVGDVLHRHVSAVIACVYKNNASNSWIIGDVYGSDVAFQNGSSNVNNRSDGCRVATGHLVVVGDVYSGFMGSSGAIDPGCGISNEGGGSFTVTGQAIVQSNANNIVAARSFSDVSNGTVIGRALGSTIARGAILCSVGICELRNDNCTVIEKFVMPTNNQTVWINCRAKSGAPVQIEIYDENGQAVLCNPLFAQGQASPADVRLGTSYANGALTGTCAIPPAGSVSLGVPVDATTGTGSVTSAEIRDLILPSILSAITQP
jgi:hypothetical protein